MILCFHIDNGGVGMTKQKTYNNNFRRYKGQSLLKIPKDYTIIDLETTDFNSFYGDIIEVGAVKVRNNLVVDQYSELLRINYDLPKRIIRITGITDEMLRKARYSYDVAKDFFDFIGNDVLIAHNANFDINFLYDLHVELELEPLTNNFVDTLRLSRVVHKDLENHKLDTLCKHYNIERANHRSLSDCISTHQVYIQLYKYLILNQELLSTKINSRISPIERVQNIDLQSVLESLHDADSQNYFFGKSICFTGKMDHLTKFEASQLVEKLGASFCKNLNKNTDILVLGNLHYQQEVYKDKSSKHKKAEDLINEGCDIEILVESDFLEIISQYYSL